MTCLKNRNAGIVNTNIVQTMAEHGSLADTGQEIDYSIYPIITVSGLLIPSVAKLNKHIHGTGNISLNAV